MATPETAIQNQDTIKQKLSTLPKRPGVYIFKSSKETVLYVGKAKNLKNRVSSYFQKTSDLDRRKAAMVKLVKDFSFIVTDNEMEALALEANLIKQYKPRFNIILRDDKNYPYLRITVQEPWPRLDVVRRIEKDGSIYFGPYVPSGGMWEALSFIRRHFNIRPCRYRLDRPMKPCLQFQMGRCPAPCADYIRREDYLKAVDEVIMFLKGEKTMLINELEEKMQRFADEERFEEAAKIRDRLGALTRAWEPQKVISPEMGDVDVAGCYIEGHDAVFQVFFIRNGRMIGAKDYHLKGVAEGPEDELLQGFLEMLYSKEIIPPASILVGVRPSDYGTLKAWLKEKRGGRVNITVPKEGKELELYDMACENARVQYNARKKAGSGIAVRELKDRLSLPSAPRSIGAFDVSNISGKEPVGGFVYWEDGEFRKDLYRHLRIKTVEQVDDYAMMAETVERVLAGIDGQWPDLIMIDGGKGHLEAANRAVKVFKRRVQMVSLAKDPDRIYTSSSSPEEEAVNLEDGSQSSLLLKRIRDEVHRFAITYHKKLRGRKFMESPLLAVEGIGKKRRLALLREFGSLDEIKRASVEALARVPGMNIKAAAAVKESLGKKQ